MFNPEPNARMAYGDPGLSRAGDFDTIIIKNIDPSTDAGEIYTDLERFGYRVHSIRNAMNASTRRAAPMFFVELVKGPYNPTVLEIKRVANQNVFIEQYITNLELIRCTACHGIDHQVDECNIFPICAWCGGPHQTRRCRIGRNFPPCCRCGRRHHADYKSCYIYRQRVLGAQMEMMRQSSEMNELSENQRTQSLTEERMYIQSPESASGVSSVDSRTESELDYSQLSTLTYTSEVMEMEYMRNTLSITMDHYLSMHWVSQQ